MTSPERIREIAVEACAKALQLASLQRDQRAWAVAAWPTALPEDPVAAFTAAKGTRRALLWHDHEWLLALGSAADIEASGPGRHAIAAQEAARLECRCAVVAEEGAPELPVLLSAIAFEDDADASPVWGKIPGARMWLPRRALWRRADAAWTIAALPVASDDDADALADRLIAEIDRSSPKSAADWTQPSDHFTELVEDAIAWIRDGVMRKVVLARAVDETPRTPIDLAKALTNLRAQAARACTVYAQDLDSGGTFIGATPELLFEAEEDCLTTMGLAGSSRRGADTEEDAALREALLASTKERKEHQLVVEHLVAALRPRCLPFDVPGTPQVLDLARIMHLRTSILARLKQANYLELLGALHPTPAVCGLPTATAIHYLQRHERLHRGLYGGVLGWSNPNACRFIVPLRGGIVHADGSRARLFAGSGIVETSDPRAELAETELKLRPMRAALQEQQSSKAGQ